MINDKTPKENLFDLSILHEMDDNEYIKDILTIFLNNTPDELNDLKKACSSKNFESICKMAHKLKSSAGLLQANGLLKILVKLEEFAKAQISDGLTVLAEQAGEEYKKLENLLKDCVKNIGASSYVSK